MLKIQRKYEKKMWGSQIAYQFIFEFEQYSIITFLHIKSRENVPLHLLTTLLILCYEPSYTCVNFSHLCNPCLSPHKSS